MPGITQPGSGLCADGPDDNQRPRPVAFVLPWVSGGRCCRKKLSGLEEKEVSCTTCSFYDARRS
jgi:hypothetical protein